ncbi:MAG: DUF3035 domain-containing protein [Sphingomonadales bacterium]
MRLSHLGFVLIAALALPACGGARSALGLDKNSPDEFAVVRTQPLVVPPDFSLRPPRPGEKRPEEMSAQAQAIAALFPGRTSLPPLSAGERALLEAAGATQVGPEIRSNITSRSEIVADKGVFLREILATPDGIVDSEGTKVERIDSQPLPAP